MTGVFLQARMSSERLPRKAVRLLCGIPVVVHAMRALKELSADVYALLTDDLSAEELAQLAEENGFQLLAGEREDVLSRYVRAADHFGTDVVVRATGDNPLVSGRVAEDTAKLFDSRAADFAALDGPPLGTGVEVIRAGALARAAAGNPDGYEREHVSPYLYRRPRQFRIARESADPGISLPEKRVTLDTEEDYAFLSRIYRELYDGTPIGIERLLQWLRRENGQIENVVKDSA